ncbi:cytochrome b561 [Phlyctema vagabunda]|uniref:Cytochrome b561 n=1 Tax=Phlyctema vagabunda TaxID=108571 RepID=A0ABR4PXU8_9HELO
MSSATGVPGSVQSAAQRGLGEDEPLLGRVGDASQQEGKPLYYNLFLGTAILAQAGVLLLTALVWANVLLTPIMLFTAHPLLNSAALLFLVQSILILQPTHTPGQKRQGTIAHFTLNNLTLDSLIAGLVVIEYNKFAHNGTHFVSPHAILGLITYIFLAIQALVGITAYFLPQLYGSVDKAKSLYKYHRISGYLILVLMLATIAAATQTDFNKNAIHIRLWAVLVSSVLLLVGILPRIKKQKLGLGSRPLSSGAFGQ